MSSHRRLYDGDSHGEDEHGKKKYIRGVNVGGWLLAERFITPYLFAVNSCHLQGSLCWYPGQMGAPTNLRNSNDTISGPPEDPYRHSIHTLCDPDVCQPILRVPTKEPNDYHERGWKSYMDYPVDEYTLGQTLRTSIGGLSMAQKYMERHWDTFLTYQDLKELKEAGVTHLRIPMSYWIRGDLQEGEPYIPGGWPYLVRAAKWCREIGGLTIWADLHGAPGSENGFDNSGIFKGVSSCKGWDQNAANVQRTVEILTDIAHGIVEEGIQDVVTGFGVLNEPFVDCNEAVVRNYYNQALSILRNTLGDHVSVFVGDTFRAARFNDGFWTDQDHHDCYLDSHPYQVFFEVGRAFTPRQHIAYVCRHDTNDVKECCYDDPPNNTIPSSGISRIIGEWSAAYDALPTAMTPFIMKHIETTGRAPFLNRTLSAERREFLRNFVEAQMVAYEARDAGISSGWLFWNFKME
jgi:glucan 1,3-beta-glucosidase